MLCSRCVAFVRRWDRHQRFRIAPLQDGSAPIVLARHGRGTTRLDTVVVVVDPHTASERLLERSAAVLYVLAGLGGGWRLLSMGLAWLPRPLLDLACRLFGRLDACPVPAPEHRERLIEG